MWYYGIIAVRGMPFKVFQKINKIADQEMEQASFVQLQKVSLKLLEVPSEQEFFKLFNFMAWMDSKIKNQAFPDVVQKQFLSKMTK